MVWKNRTHEYDDFAKHLLDGDIPLSKIYVFGAGILGSEFAIVLKEYKCFAGYIDNDKEKQIHGYKGDVVYSLDKYLEKRDGIIVIMAVPQNIIVIEKQLISAHLVHKIDYFKRSEFCEQLFPIISTYFYNKSYVFIAQIVLTEKCSLKCKKCAHGCYAVDNNAKDLALQKVYKSADSFFAKIDFCNEFVLIGGEPLLYKELAQVIKYIGERYRNKIGIFSITTNGTIIPNEETIKYCKEYNVLLRISNYMKQVPKIESKYIHLMNVLKTNQISYVLGREELEWLDYGFEYVNRNFNEEELVKVFDACKTPCREVRENRFYFCVMARSVSDNLEYHIGENDYLDLDKLDEKNYKKELLEFNLGYSEKGYLDMCAHCHGAEAKNYPIPAAEQLER